MGMKMAIHYTVFVQYWGMLHIIGGKNVVVYIRFHENEWFFQETHCAWRHFIMHKRLEVHLCLHLYGQMMQY